VARGAPVFRDEGEADRFGTLLAATKKRESVQILAWCFMSDHFQTSIPWCPAPLKISAPLKIFLALMLDLP
jgi:REP element-mobilizing transposase RayT